MWDQIKNNNIDQKTLKQFVHLVKTVDDSPTLIQRIAENREFLFLCASIVKQNEDIRFNNYKRSLEIEARRHYISLDKIIERLMPIATALGINDSNSESIQTDYYQILGISPKASLKDIKKAYRFRALETHPDTQTNTQINTQTNQQKRENKKFISIIEAYKVLSDKTLRHRYNLSREKAYNCSWAEAIEKDLTEKQKTSFLHHYSLPFIIMILVLVAVTIGVDKINRELALNSHEFNVPVEKKMMSAVDSNKNEIIGDEQLNAQHIQNISLVSYGATQSHEPIPQIEYAELNIKHEMPEQNHRIAVKEKANIKNKTEEAGGEKQKAVVPAEQESESKVGNEVKTAAEILTLSAREKTPITKSSVDIVDHIKTFLNHYSKTYENRDLDEFMKLFTDNAIENGKPIKSLVPIYQRNFESLDSIKYTIALKYYTLDLALDRIRIKGNFHLSWRKKNDTQIHSYQGLINLVLVPRAGDSFQVENLSYKFAE